MDGLELCALNEAKSYDGAGMQVLKRGTKRGCSRGWAAFGRVGVDVDFYADAGREDGRVARD